MRTFTRCLRAELLLLRRSPPLLVALVAPYVVVLFVFLVLLFRGHLLLGGAVSPWRWSLDAATSAWSLIFLPPFLGLAAALHAGIEVRAEGFKQLFVLPVPRLTLYAAKQAAAVCLLALTHAVLAAGLLLSGLLLRWLRPGLGFEEPAPLLHLLAVAASLTAASSFALAIHHWVALLRGSVAASIGLGFGAMTSLVAIESLEPGLMVFHPWGYAARAASAFAAGAPETAWPLAGLAGLALFVPVAGWTFCRRDVL